MGLKKFVKKYSNPFNAVNPGGIIGGSVGRGLSTLADFHDAEQTAIKNQLGTTWDGIRKGRSVGDTLADTLAIGQGRATDVIDKGFGRAGENVADFFRGATRAEGANLRSTDDTTKAWAQGDVSAGNRSFDDANRTFVRDPSVAPILATLASIYGGPAVYGWLGGGTAGTAAAGGAAAGATAGNVAAAAGAGAAVQGGTAAVMGADDRDIGRAALYGAAGGAVSQGVSGLAPTGNNTADAAIRGGVTSGTTSALRGDSSEQIGRNAVIGGASSAAGQYLGETFNSQPAGQLASSATNLSLRKLWEDPGAVDMGQYYQDMVNQYANWNNQYEMKDSTAGTGADWEKLAQTPEGQSLLALFEEQKKDPAAKGAIGGAGQYGSGSDQVKDEFTGEYLA
jgi:hypothetical protein